VNFLEKSIYPAGKPLHTNGAVAFLCVGTALHKSKDRQIAQGGYEQERAK